MRTCRSFLHRLIFISIAIICNPEDRGIADTLDVFPLNVGAQFRYAYERITDSYLYGISKWDRDSGTIEYIIRDTTHIGEDLIRWWFTERRSLSHWGKRQNILDTFYVIQDSVESYLVEVDSGGHELQGGSLAWFFPLTKSYAGSPVYRFIQDSSIVLTDSFYCAGGLPPYDLAFDSVFMNTLHGMEKRHWYLCYDDDMMGSSDRGTAVLEFFTTAVDPQQGAIPSRTLLFNNYPNPFNPRTTIEYFLQDASEVSVCVYNLSGVQLSILVDEYQPVGFHQVEFEAASLPSGSYFVRLRAGVRTEYLKISLVR